MSPKKSGPVDRLMQIALENAKIALEQYIKSSAKNSHALEEIQKIFN
jgi:excinuclease UvrABC nuclease subunit